MTGVSNEPPDEYKRPGRFTQQRNKQDEGASFRGDTLEQGTSSDPCEN